MSPEEFVKNLRKEVLISSEKYQEYLISQIGKNIKKNKNWKNETHQFWVDLIIFLSKLNEKERDLFLKYSKLIAKDSVSYMLGVLDGVSTLDLTGTEYTLLANGVKISGDLQDEFVELDQSEM